MKLCFWLVSLSVISPILAWLHRCPPEENLHRECSCKKGNSEVLVACRYMNDTDVLSESLGSFQNYVVDGLVIYDSGTLEMVYGPFYKLNIHRITFRNVKFGLFPILSTFRGIETTLESLTLENCTVGSWRWTEGRAFIHLTHLTFKETNLPEILNPSFFEKFPARIETLNIMKCNVRKLKNNTFERFKGLRMLKLEDNWLTSLSRNSLPLKLSRLIHLSLRGNPLEELPNDMFIHMPRLEILMLGGTQIKRLPEETFKPVWDQLEEVYFNNVRLNCDCSSAWLITAKRNKLKQPPICKNKNKPITHVKHGELCIAKSKEKP